MSSKQKKSGQVYRARGVREIVNMKVTLPFKNIGTTDTESLLIEYAENKIVGKCYDCGYISSDSIRVINYDSMKIIRENVVINAIYEFEVFNPCVDMIMDAKIVSITKLGISAVVDKDADKNPYLIFADRIHNDHIIMEEQDSFNVEKRKYEEITDSKGKKIRKKIYSMGDHVRIKVIGFQYEINDKHITVLGKVQEM